MSNGGVPLSTPATEPDRKGPLAWWRGHDSPLPMYGALVADPGFAYTLEPSGVGRQAAPPARGPLCHTCIVTLRYRHMVAQIHWREITEGVEVCDECDRIIRPVTDGVTVCDTEEREEPSSAGLGELLEGESRREHHP